MSSLEDAIKELAAAIRYHADKTGRVSYAEVMAQQQAEGAKVSYAEPVAQNEEHSVKRVRRTKAELEAVKGEAGDTVAVQTHSTEAILEHIGSFGAIGGFSDIVPDELSPAVEDAPTAYTLVDMQAMIAPVFKNAKLGVTAVKKIYAGVGVERMPVNDVPPGTYAKLAELIKEALATVEGA